MAMFSTGLLTELHNLSRAEKLEVTQVLVRDLTIQETILKEEALLTLVSGAHHEVWSPSDAAATAAALTRLLEHSGSEYPPAAGATRWQRAAG